MEQRNPFERAGSHAQMGLQGSAWPWEFPHPGAMTIPLDVCELGNEFVVRAMLPGVTPDSVNVSANVNTLTLTGEFAAPDWLSQAPSGGQSTATGQQQIGWLQECPVGKFARTVTLPFPIDPAQARSTFDNGILTLRFPKSKAHMMQTIQIQAGANAGKRGTDSGSR